MKYYVRGISKFLFKAASSFYLIKIFLGEYFYIFWKRRLYKNVHLTDKQRKEVQLYWQKYYGRKISTRWHRLYQSYNGQFNKKYFPEVLYTTQLERKLNNREIGRVVSDKSFLPMYYRDVKNVRLPATYIINNSGIFYTSERKIISTEKAAALMENIGELIIKPTIDSSSGELVKLCDFRAGVDVKSGGTVLEIISLFKADFIVQEKIVPSEILKKLYPHSINTFRMITYLVKDRVVHAPVTLSMGRNGNHVDNIQAGGISIAVSDDGMLNKEGYTHYQETYLSHPDTGVTFADYKIPKVKEIIQAAKELHEKTPHARILSWDLTIDKNEDIILLEFNFSGQSVWFPQMVSGKAVFGDHTEEMLKLIKK